RNLALELAENQRCVVSAEPEGIGHDMFRRTPARLIWHIVQVTFRVRRLIIYRGWQNFFSNRLDTEYGLDRTGGSKQMTGHRFGGGNRNMIRILAEDRFNRSGLALII